VLSADVNPGHNCHLDGDSRDNPRSGTTVKLLRWASHTLTNNQLTKMSNQQITNINDLAELLGCEPNQDHLSHRVFKDTDCGAWIEVKENGVQLGTIVEGSDAEIKATFLTYPFTDEAYYEAIEYLENEAEREWNLANGEPEENAE